MEKTYMFYTDPGHSWLRVLRTEIETIKGQISSFSYQNGKYVYLEEDCDAGIFLKHRFGEDVSFARLQEKGLLKEKYAENTIIRSYEPFRA